MANNSTENYLAEHFVLHYLEDAIAQLLSYKDDMPKVDVNRFFAQYFQTLRNGDHTLLREFAFMNLTPYNRACFIRLFYNSFVNIGKKGDLLSIRDYFSLVSILCNDFPYEILQKTAKIVLIEDAHDCLISFTDFLYAFQLQLYYQEFLELSHQTYQALLESQAQNSRDIFVPTDHSSEVKTENKTKASSQNADGVDSTKFCRMLCQLHEKHKCNIPDQAVLKQVLSASSTVTFYGFLVALAKSPSINEGIGKLPARENIFDGIELSLKGLQFHSGTKSANVAASSSAATAALTSSDDVSLSVDPVPESPKPATEVATTTGVLDVEKPSQSKQTTPRINSTIKKKEPKQSVLKKSRAIHSLRHSRNRSDSSDSDSTDTSDSDT